MAADDAGTDCGATFADNDGEYRCHRRAGHWGSHNDDDRECSWTDATTRYPEAADDVGVAPASSGTRSIQWESGYQAGLRDAGVSAVPEAIGHLRWALGRLDNTEPYYKSDRDALASAMKFLAAWDSNGGEG